MTCSLTEYEVTCNRCGVTIMATEWIADDDFVLCADCYNEVGVFYGEAVIEV